MDCNYLGFTAHFTNLPKLGKSSFTLPIVDYHLPGEIFFVLDLWEVERKKLDKQKQMVYYIAVT